MPRHTKALRNLTQLVIDGKAAFPDGERCWYTAKDARLSINKKVLFNDENDILYFVTAAGCHWVLAQALLIRSEQFGALQWIEGVDAKFLRRDFTLPFTNGDGKKQASGCRICRLPWENFASLENKRDMVVPMVVYINTNADPPFPLLGRLACLEGSGQDLKEVLLKIQSDPSVCILVCKEFALQYDCNSKTPMGATPSNRTTAVEEPVVGIEPGGAKEAKTPSRARGKQPAGTSSRPASGSRRAANASQVGGTMAGDGMDNMMMSAGMHEFVEDPSAVRHVALQQHVDGQLPTISTLPLGVSTVSIAGQDNLNRLILEGGAGMNGMAAFCELPQSMEHLPLTNLQHVEVVPRVIREGNKEHIVLCLANPVLQGPDQQHMQYQALLQDRLPAFATVQGAQLPIVVEGEADDNPQLLNPHSPFSIATLQGLATNAALEQQRLNAAAFTTFAEDGTAVLDGEGAHIHTSLVPDTAAELAAQPVPMTEQEHAQEHEQDQEQEQEHVPSSIFTGNAASVSNGMAVEGDDSQWRSRVKSPFAGASLANLAAGAEAEEEPTILTTSHPFQQNRSAKASPVPALNIEEPTGHQRVQFVFPASHQPSPTADAEVHEEEVAVAHTGDDGAENEHEELDVKEPDQEMGEEDELSGDDAPSGGDGQYSEGNKQFSFLQIHTSTDASQISRIRGKRDRIEANGARITSGLFRNAEGKANAAISISIPKSEEQDSVDQSVFQLSYPGPKKFKVSE